ncbi:hypothetical protein [Synechococcus sp. PCC 7336]|uniref:hypothetical protein n=1 Tax=Synechococcus sp. PCC 7336 TaxID=195250 RepID=UPI0003450ED0|nr:hypothetical protein [Synechococcus sp. PCC 7336]
MSILYVAISAHGFGHVTRTAALIDRLQKLNPDILPIFVTSAPRWLIEKYVSGRFLYRPRALDVGVVQADSLATDLDATLAKLKALQAKADVIVRSEVDFIKLNRVRMVFADMPPLACAIARAARLPCWMAGNFGWDFIYRDYGPAFQTIADWVAELYGNCDRLFRLPFHAPMSAFPQIEDTGLTGGEPILSPAEIRDRLQLERDRPTVLLTFGGLGLRGIPYDNVDAYPDWQFITLDRNAPDRPNLLRLNGEQWRPVDLMPACDQVAVKPGYGTFSEAMRVGVPVRCITRSGFAEAQLLLNGLQNYSRHQILTPAQVFDRAWDWLEDAWVEPSQAGGLDMGGNVAIAQALADALAD